MNAFATTERRLARTADDFPSLAIAMAVLALVCASQADAVASLARRWGTQAGYSHGPLVAVLLVVLAWSRRDVLTPSRGLRALPAILLVGSIMLMAVLRAAHVDVLQWALLPVLAFATLWLAMGPISARALAFPTFALLYAVPVWEVFTPSLQQITATASGWLLTALGVRAHISGTFVTVPSGMFEIAGGCSGISYLVVALTISTSAAFVERLPRIQFAGLVAASIAAAIVANWVRVTAIVAIGDATEMRSPLIADHATLGWWIFAFALLPVMLVLRRFPRSLPSRRSSIAVARGALDPSGAMLAALLLAGSCAWTIALTSSPNQSASAPQLPQLRNGAGPVRPSGAWHPSFPGASVEIAAGYYVPLARLDAYVAAFGYQGPGHKLIGEGARIGGERWRVARSSRKDAPGGPVIESELVDGYGRTRIVRFWYEVRGTRVADRVMVKALEGLSAFGLRSRSGIAAISAACTPDCQAAREAIDSGFALGLDELTAGTGGPTF